MKGLTEQDIKKQNPLQRFVVDLNFEKEKVRLKVTLAQWFI